jgi:hypothetical protein
LRKLALDRELENPLIDQGPSVKVLAWGCGGDMLAGEAENLCWAMIFVADWLT